MNTKERPSQLTEAKRTETTDLVNVFEQIQHLSRESPRQRPFLRRSQHNHPGDRVTIQRRSTGFLFDH